MATAGGGSLSRIINGISSMYPGSSSSSNSSLPNGGPLIMSEAAIGDVRRMEQGMVMTKFFPKRPERRMFQVKMETRQLVWYRVQGNRPEGAVDLREVKEIRPSKNSRDFEKWPDEAKKIDAGLCFVIFSGSEFRLKTLSLVATDAHEYRIWLNGLEYLVKDTQSSSYVLQVDRWLWKEFNSMERSNSVTMKDIKSWLPKVNCKMSNNRLRERYQEIDHKMKGIGFNEFSKFYHNIMFMDSIFKDYFDCYSGNGERITPEEFQTFLNKEQKDPIGSDMAEVQRLMTCYLDDPTRKANPYFTVQEFLEFLFSHHNSVWDDRCSKVFQDLDRPMSHYWIASSHNTYLTGDQLSSESSCEAYARVLREGCRCIELDCWDGPDQMPYIYHGHTLTSKIKFLDVLNTIKLHCWVKSDLPLVLSIENHCSLMQQRNMAKAFKEVFGDELVVEPVDKDAIHLPSPNQLRRKIILKHKKLPEGMDENKFSFTEEGQENDISANCVKYGFLYLQDPINHTWHPHYFGLTETQLHYTGEANTEDAEEEEQEEGPELNGIAEDVPNDELHFGEQWFHGRLDGRRKRAEELLKQYSYLGDGTFLVRDSETFVGDFSLSFWRQGQVCHCRIKSHQERGQTRYSLIQNLSFDSLYSLINHHRQNPLRSQEFQITLTEPVPQEHSHEGRSWYHDNLSRMEAEYMLSCIPQDGAFLVRRRLLHHTTDTDPSQYAISFRAEAKVKHCKIRQEGRLYLIGTAQFESLVELVTYFEKHPLYKKMKLKYPANRELVQRFGFGPDPNAFYGNEDQNLYSEPNSFTSKIRVKAIYDYKANREDELSFCKHAIITNVNNKQDGGWWRGDYGGKKSHWFPSNYVEVIETDDNSDNMPFGAMQKGTIDIAGCSVERVLSNITSHEYVMKIQSVMSSIPIEIAAENEADLYDWMKTIRKCADIADRKHTEDLKLERQNRIAKEFSDLIVYCRAVPYSDKIAGSFYEMSSFPETKMEKLCSSSKGRRSLTKYNKNQFSRVYPKGQRFDSSNYDPLAMWNCACQMLALNYQTADKSMHLNHARFMDNGNCGFVLQPDSMFYEQYDPSDKRTLEGVDPVSLTVTIIGARHLTKTGRGIVSPFVEVEVVGADYDNQNKYKTGTKTDNGFNPIWNESCEFDVHNPDLAFLRFVVYDEDMFSDPNFIGQATYPIKCLRSGHRSVPLKNGYNEPLELSSLLIYFETRNPKEGADSDIYASIMELRDRQEELTIALEVSERSGDINKVHQVEREINAMQQEIFAKNEERREKRTATKASGGKAMATRTPSK
ncbi:1-phosphatidylinositol 4,5-bisphosphate phosphodiesterase gamma-1-like isoform X2 [Lineus longissimus]|uniref:1-phosphatidylinositol 4,5-bisphosphate phosphodiesterase gamma-1-like isoform X2 n=1 Tax=Lineus longissimus TaxID=88925 RepID=UPI002B4E7A54